MGSIIYRNSWGGRALKKNLYIDDHFIGESAPDVFFYKQLNAGQHKISTESEFSNNDLTINTLAGKNYYIRQYMKLGVFVGGANLEEMSEKQAQEDIKKLGLAITH